MRIKLPSWRKQLAIRFGFAVALCANYSCSNTGKMASQDPFSGHPQPSAMGPESPIGNHKMLEEAGVPLNQYQQGYGQQTAAPHGQIPPQAQMPTAPVPQAGSPMAMPPMMPMPGAQVASTEGSIRVKNEWPALPEQTVGYQPPEAPTPIAADQKPLPPGGYESPIGTTDPWHQTVQLTSHAESEPTSGQIVQTAFQAPTTAGEPHVAPATEFTPAEPRLAIQGPTCESCGDQGCHCQVSMTQYCPPVAACNDCDPAFYPDEYLCDGGDRKLPVHYSPGAREGLDTQDTIAEYSDDTGEHHMKPSNQVCVYAPRFGAVRTVAGSSENLGVDRALGAYETVNGLSMNAAAMPNVEQQTEQINSTRVRSRASGLETEEITLGMEQATKTVHHTKLQNTHEDSSVAGQINMERWQSPVNFDGIQYAAAWTREKSPVAIATDVAGSEVYSWFRPEELVGLEDKKKIGDLLIEKAADIGAAKPGDVITFTIHYRNTGERPLFNVQIIDNLTPRLEFVEGSDKSDHPADLILEDNQEGSLILRWQIAEELKGGTAGTITFQAKVR